MILPKHHYSRDPLDILIERENRSCTGCKHLCTMVVCGEQIKLCEKDRKANRKCSQYLGDKKHGG